MEREWEEAKRYIAGGVNSPVRAFRAVGGTPIFIDNALGPWIRDTRGRAYVDFVGSWGPMIVGHAHMRVVEALRQQVEKGSSFGAPCELETELARRICQRMPACERVRFVSSGTEAAMSAIRLARGATGRDEIVKIEGCYHGHADSLLVQAGSGVMTLGIPGSAGVPASLAELTRVVPFNDSAAVERLLTERGEKIACLILEPVAGNMGVIPPAPGYLQAIRELTRKHGVLMVLDEVMTGFRVHRSGAQGLYDVAPDLTCLGKIIGGGLPAAAYAGSAELMAKVAPDGPVYQAGTLSGNPLAMRAGIETLDLLDEPETYERLESVSALLQRGLARAASDAGVTITINRVGSMLTVFFTAATVTDHATAQTADTEKYAKFFHAMLSRRIYLPPSQFEALFLSLAHAESEIRTTVDAAVAAFRELEGRS